MTTAPLAIDVDGFSLPVIGYAVTSRHTLDSFATALEAWLHACGVHARWSVEPWIIPIVDTSSWITEAPTHHPDDPNGIILR